MCGLFVFDSAKSVADFSSHFEFCIQNPLRPTTSNAQAANLRADRVDSFRSSTDRALPRCRRHVAVTSNSEHSSQFSDLFVGYWPARSLDAFDGSPTYETYVLAQASAQTGPVHR